MPVTHRHMTVYTPTVTNTRARARTHPAGETLVTRLLIKKVVTTWWQR
jgi:hypothetical protein